MYSLSVPSILLWFGFCTLTKQVMDVQMDILGWLDDATLFPSEPVDGPLPLCFDDLLGNPGNEKTKGHCALLDDIPDVADILDGEGWMDEKIDLTILDSAQDWLGSTNDAEKLMVTGDPASALESCMDFNFLSDGPGFATDCVPTESPKYSEETKCVQPTNVSLNHAVESCSSPERVLLETGLQLPCSPMGSGSESASSPACFSLETGLQLPASPAESCSGYSAISAPSPQTSEASASDAADSSFTGADSPVVYCVEIIQSDSPSNNVSEYTPPSKPASRGRNIKSQKSNSRARPSPYQLDDLRRNRKKVQNKEAAARYRMKKREQDKLLSDEVAVLEAEQANLQDKHDKLQSEIKYLKSLMIEMFKARGILK